jgi:hypothetical protein
VADSRF